MVEKLVQVVVTHIPVTIIIFLLVVQYKFEIKLTKSMYFPKDNTQFHIILHYKSSDYSIASRLHNNGFYFPLLHITLTQINW